MGEKKPHIVQIVDIMKKKLVACIYYKYVHKYVMMVKM